MSETKKPLSFNLEETINLGRGVNSGEGLIDALEDSGCHVTASAKDIMYNSVFKTSKIIRDVQIVNITVAELGFTEGATVKDIYERAVGFGLLLCPPEVGPLILLQNLERRDEKIRIAMNSILTMSGYPAVFSIENKHHERWLDVVSAQEESYWLVGVRCIFVRRKVGSP